MPTSLGLAEEVRLEQWTESAHRFQPIRVSHSQVLVVDPFRQVSLAKCSCCEKIRACVLLLYLSRRTVSAGGISTRIMICRCCGWQPRFRGIHRTSHSAVTSRADAKNENVQDAHEREMQEGQRMSIRSFRRRKTTDAKP